MRLVLAAGDGLNPASCDRLLARLGTAQAASSDEITIDLQAAAFIDPYGAACLCLVARHLAGRKQHLILVLPSSRRAQVTVAQTGLPAALRQWAELRNLPGHELQDQRNGTLPLSLIHSRSDVQTVLTYLVNLAQRRLGFDPGDVLDASKVVSELCYNVVDHSQADGLVVAQIGQDRQGRRFVSLAVADAGIGVRASLASRYPEAAHWRHGDAIQRALGGLSSRASGGGAGLRSIYAVVRRYSGRLAIRSGDERLYVSAEHQPRTLDGAWFPGTQVGISFSQR
jgi:anti-sigma regulatory factor (Ser/Thr protein kinase)/anti-anti-sigma regulatory factor